MAAGGDPADVNNPATDTWLTKNQKSPWAGKEGVQTELTEEQKKYAEEYAKKKEEKGNAGEEKGKHVADKSTFHAKKKGIIRAGLGLHLPKMLKQLTIIDIYQRGWFTLGAGIQRGFQPFSSSPNMDP